MRQYPGKKVLHVGANQVDICVGSTTYNLQSKDTETENISFSWELAMQC